MKGSVQRLFLVLVLLGTAIPAAAQTAEPAPSAAVQTADAGAQDAASTFPVRDTAPRLQRAYLHVFLAFAIAWVLILGYAVTLGRRFSRLEKDVERFHRS